MAGKRQPPKYIQDVLANASRQHGIPFDMLKRFAGIESTFNPRARTGQYKGMFQLSKEEFKRGGGKGNIFDPVENTNAFASVLKKNMQEFSRQMGRDPVGWEAYLAHQQGTAGAPNHLKNPDLPAWKNMYNTGEGRRKGVAWAKKAIRGNIPVKIFKTQFGGKVENVSSRQFTDMWQKRYAREGGSPGTEVAFDPSAANTPDMPVRGMRTAANDLPEDRGGPPAINYPDQNVVMVGGGENPPPVPDRRGGVQVAANPESGAGGPPVPEHRPIKFDYRAPEYASANDIGAGGPPMPGRNPQDAPEPPSSAILPGSAEASRSSTLTQPVGAGGSSGTPGSDNWQGRAFGGSFGELYARPDQGSGLLKDVLPTGKPGGMGGMGAPPPVPLFRQFMQGLFGGFG